MAVSPRRFPGDSSLDIQSREPRDRLVLALANAQLDEPYALAELRPAIREYVASLRKAGDPPEQVLVTLKETVTSAAPGIDPYARRALIERVVSWCINEYYTPRAD